MPGALVNLERPWPRLGAKRVLSSSSRPGGAKETGERARLLRMLRARNCPLTPAPSPSAGRGERWATSPRVPALPPPLQGGCVETRTLPRVARHAAVGAPPVATLRHPVGAKNGTRRHSPPPRRGEERHPWPQSAAPLGRTTAVAKSARLWPLREIAGVAFVQFFTLHSALLTPVPRPSHFSSIFYAYWHGSCAQRPMLIRPCCKPSNSSQNRSKRRHFPSKSDQKRAHFVMPILTFWGVTPSGASAKAVLAFRKGKKGAFSGAPGRVPKLSTIPWRLWITPGHSACGSSRLRC